MFEIFYNKNLKKKKGLSERVTMYEGEEENQGNLSQGVKEEMLQEGGGGRWARCR